MLISCSEISIDTQNGSLTVDERERQYHLYPDSILKTQKVKGIRWKNENADVLLIRLNGMEHNLPQTGNCDFEGSEYIWDFFKDKRRDTEMTGSFREE